MPQEQIYQPQVMPGATAPIPLASPQDFGAGIGQGIEQVGSALERGQKIARQLRADEQATTAASDLARARLGLEEARNAARANPAPLAAGHAEAMAQSFDAATKDITAGITDTRVRRSIEAQIQEQRTAFVGNEDAWQAATAAKESVGNIRETGNRWSAFVRTSADPDAYATATKAIDGLVDSQQGIGEYREPVRRELHAQLAMAAGQRLQDTNPKALVVDLDSGHFSDVLDGQQIDRLRDGAQVEIRRNETLAQHQIALQKAATNEAIATAKAQQAAGIVVPDATLDQLAQAARANGDTSNATELSALRIHNGVNRETQGWTAQQYDSELARLRALGPKASPDDQVRLHALETIAPGRKQQFERDPGQWAAINGAPPPPLNFADPATWAARRQWAATVSKAAGQPVPLLQPAEVNQLKANFASGDKGRLEVIDTIAPLGGRDALQAMRQIAPDDAVAQRLVGLPMINRASAASGAAARQADRSLIDDMKPDGSGKLALEKYNTDVAPALARFAPQDANAAREIAGNLYADWARAHGVHTFNPSQYGTFLQVAVGGAIDGQGVFHGGIGYWNNVPVKLPAEQSQAQFEKVLSSVKWNDDPKVPRPVYSDGKTTITPQVLRSYVPVARSDGFYEFHGPGGIVVASNTGGIFKLDLGYLGRKYLK